MNVVLDTNVVVSGLLTHQGVCAELVDRMRMGAFRLCVDGRILAEYAEVLRRPELAIPAGATTDFLDFVRHRAERVDPALAPTVLPDEADLAFLEVALAADALLVTGNTRHFPAPACQGVHILTPTDFLSLLRHLA